MALAPAMLGLVLSPFCFPCFFYSLALFLLNMLTDLRLCVKTKGKGKTKKYLKF